MTNAERLKHPCPTCSARPGDPCRYHTGKPTAQPHRTRGPGQYEKQIEAEEQRRVDRKKANYGPLFQEFADNEVKLRTTAELLRDKQHQAAKGAEQSGLICPANRGLEWVRLWHLRRAMESIIGADAARKHWERALRVYEGKEEYIEGAIRKALTTPNHIPLRHELRFDPARANNYNRDGRYLVDVEAWPPDGWSVIGWCPPLTNEEYDRRFPKLDHKQGVPVDDEPDDGGLFDRMMFALTQAPSRSA